MARGYQTSDQTKLEIARLYENGLSFYAICRIEGMPSHRTISEIVRAHVKQKNAQEKADAARAPELIAKPAGICPVSGAKMFLVVDNEHTHIVPEAIVKAASGRKWKVAA